MWLELCFHSSSQFVMRFNLSSSSSSYLRLPDENLIEAKAFTQLQMHLHSRQKFSRLILISISSVIPKTRFDEYGNYV